MKRMVTLMRWLLALVIFINMAGAPVSAFAAPLAQEDDPHVKAAQMLARMTPEEKVGQLFLVTFKGRDVSSESAIYDLVVNHHVGGVVLLAGNDNFIGPEGTIQGIYELNSSLQNLAWQRSQLSLSEPNNPGLTDPQYIPLMIGISQDGDGAGGDQILSGLTPLPSQMAIGATWDTTLSQQVGETLGRELSALGFNLVFGPSLDVLEVMYAGTGEDLGTQTFGGDPYWVGELGKSYITGIHTGSEGRIAVIAKHFPGRGSSDRQPEEEVATVRKSLEQLKQIELAPFFSITGNSTDPLSTTDGLLVSHIRYQGLQGNIRATTRPVSFDQAALEQIMSLPEFSGWRQTGGLVVSDDLGSPAVRNFYSPSGEVFDARQIARNAFLAGNDLLFAGNIVSSNDPDNHTTILRTLEFFAQKYREDPAFAQRVDVSVERILALKYKLYGSFTQSAVMPQPVGLNMVGTSLGVTFATAQESATLLSPAQAELSDALPRPPGQAERIIFFTDQVESRQCSTCILESSLAVDGLQKTVLRLYGPDADGQVYDYNLSSYSFIDLSTYLNHEINDDTTLKRFENDLRSADWVVFVMGKVSNERSASLALQRLLAERPDMVRNKNLIVFAVDAPYFLDATDISKLTAYYGIYSRSQPFLDTAARLLFQESVPVGAPPISVPALGYDLINITAPEPTQIIPLMIDIPPVEGETPLETLTPEASPQPPVTFRIGDIIPVKTGVIYDHNRNPVPDGTVVRFYFETGSDEGSTTTQFDTVTTQGVARASFQIATAGLLEIRAAADPAQLSDILQLDIPRNEAAGVTQIAPTLSITETPEPTATPPQITSTPETDTQIGGTPSAGLLTGRWLLSMIIIWGSAVWIYFLVWRRISMRWGVRWSLLAVSGGLLGFIVYSLVFPASDPNATSLRVLGGLLVSLAGVGLGCLGGWYWYMRTNLPQHLTPSRRPPLTD